MFNIMGWLMKHKRNKLNFVFVIAVIVTGVYDLFLICFDIAQFLIVSKNSAMISNAFVFFNIFGAVLNFAVLCLGIVLVILKFRRVKSKD